MIVDQYAVFGNPIAHSRSPLIHRLFAEQTNQTLSYQATEVEVDQFIQTAHTFFTKTNHLGLNITVPFKQQAYALADQLSQRAQLAGAVNTLAKKTVNCKKLIVGDNTDGIGLVNDINGNLGWSIQGKNVLLLGAGGAVRGVLGPLLETAPSCIVIANRTIKKAEELADTFNKEYPANVSGMGFDAIGDQPFDLIINGTSASLAGDLPPLPESIVTQYSHCYDMMYSKQDTVFIQWAKENGVINCADGLGMLVEQAAESFFIWRNIKPKTQPVIEQVRKIL